MRSSVYADRSAPVNLLEAFDAPTASPVTPAPVAPAPAPAGAPPAITANRRRIDNRFPVLAFSVRTQGRPWFEVLLTTDRTLFDPANAARRTPQNFYAGRQDGGLARATAEETAYVVPAAALRRFAAAVPRPAEIFFTVAAYDRPDGPPYLPLPVAILATTAPSVAISADFQARTTAFVLGVPAEKLQPPDATGVLPAPVAPGEAVAQAWSVPGDEALALDDASDAWFADPQALALDDATAFDAPAPAPAHEPEPPYDALTDDEAWPVSSNGHGASAAYEEPPAVEDVVPYGFEDEPPLDGDPVAQAYDDEPADVEALDYDDGFGTAAGNGNGNGWSEAAASTWPAGASEPEQLADADDQRLEEELAYEAADVEPYDDDAPAGAAADDELDDTGVAAALEAPLDIPGKIAIVTKIGRLFEASAGYAGINADTEFSNPRLPQYQRWHVGLSYGFIQFTQDSGGLGQLLRMMRERDAARFREIFGPDADALVEVTNRPGPSGSQVPGGRSARVQPVGGADLWTEPWVARFRAAAAHPPFQAAQNELAVRRHVDPMLPFAAGFGLNTERALAMVVDRAIQMGNAGARRWITDAIGPIRTDAQRQQALGALGLTDIAAFQRSAGVRADGDFGPLTHAAMVGALRRLGAASPIPIPTRDQMLDAIVARADAANVFWRRRPHTLRTSREFGDAPLTWTATPAAR